MDDRRNFEQTRLTDEDGLKNLINTKAKKFIVSNKKLERENT